MIEFTALDDDLNPIEGAVVAHSESHDVILGELAKQSAKQIAIEYIGEDWPGDLAYLL